MLDRFGVKGWARLLGWLAVLAFLMGAAAAHAQDKG